MAMEMKILWEMANLGSKAIHDPLGVVFFVTSKRYGMSQQAQDPTG